MKREGSEKLREVSLTDCAPSLFLSALPIGNRIFCIFVRLSFKFISQISCPPPPPLPLAPHIPRPPSVPASLPPPSLQSSPPSLPLGVNYFCSPHIMVISVARWFWRRLRDNRAWLQSCDCEPQQQLLLPPSFPPPHPTCLPHHLLPSLTLQCNSCSVPLVQFLASASRRAVHLWTSRIPRMP